MAAAADPAASPLLWHIDDGEHQLAVSSFTAAAAGWRFRGFTTGRAAVRTYRDLPRTALPQAILMDYFIGDERGDRVTHDLCRVRAEHPVIIGHSSAIMGSRAILAAGGALILPKRAGPDGRNPDLSRWLQEWKGEESADRTEA